MGPGSHTARLAAGSALVLLALAWGVEALAQPVVQVGASTRLELHSARRPDGVRLRGVLLDDLDAPVIDAPIALRVRGLDDASVDLRHQLSTGHDGSFRIELPLHDGRFEARAHFAGEGLHGSATAEHSIDLTRADVRLSFVEPARRRVNLDRASAMVTVRASSARGGAGLEIVVDDALGRELARGQTDAAGLLQLQLPTASLGAAGMGKLVARSTADALRGAGRAELALLRVRPTRLELTAHTSTDGESLQLSGTLQTSGGPLADKAVGIFDRDAHLASILTDARGRFEHGPVTLRADADGPRALRLQARFQSDAPWHPSSHSQELVFSTITSRGPTPWWLLLPILVCALLTWWLSRGVPVQRASEPLRAPPGSRIGIETGSAARGRATQRTVGGQIVSAEHGRALAHAQAELIAQAGATVHTLQADADGRFRSEELEPGPWTLRIVAPGHAPVAHQLTVPHRGEWSSVVGRLRSLRSEALRAFAPVAEAELGSREGLELVTPREVVARAGGRGRASAALRALVARVERVAFGPQVPSGGDVEAITDAAREVQDSGRDDDKRATP